jgi:hypothetical protein
MTENKNGVFSLFEFILDTDLSNKIVINKPIKKEPKK